MQRILFAPSDDRGCGWYRIIIPAKVLVASKLAEVQVSMTITEEQLEWADIIVWQRQYKDNLLTLAKQFSHKKHIFELDDNLFAIAPDNPVYKVYQDTEIRQKLGEFIQFCDHVTCSTEPLRQALLKYNKNVTVLPNSTLPEYLQLPTSPTNTKKEVRIGWMGSIHHYNDLRIVEGALKDICNKYSNVKLVWMGWLPDYIKDAINPNQIEIHEWVEFTKYYPKLATLNLDIGIAPIQDNIFNSSKSNLKFIEYSIFGACTIASNVYPYATTITDGHNGIIVKKSRYKDWYKALDRVVNDADLRYKLATNAQQAVLDDYSYYKNIHAWVDVYNKVGDMVSLKKSEYDEWMEKNEPSNSQLKKQKGTKLLATPKISIIMNSASESSQEELLASITSVRHQTYSNWELLLDKDIISATIIGELNDPRIVEEYENISGKYVMFLGSGDALTKFSLFETVKLLNSNEHIDFLYGDEDKINITTMKRHSYFHKFAWSPDTLRSFNYIGNSYIIGRELFDSLSVPAKDNFFNYGMILRATEKATDVCYINKVLYSKNDSKEYASGEAKPTIIEHLSRVNYDATVSDVQMNADNYKVDYSIVGSPKVSIIIPNHNQKDLLEKCVESILDLTIYDNYEIVIAENNSTDDDITEYYTSLVEHKNVKIIEWNDSTFNFSKINNDICKQVDCEYLLFLNNDIELITPDWIEQMLCFAQRDDVGVVGAKLYYPDDTVQHAGVMMGMGGVAGHVFKGAPRKAYGHQGRLQIAQNVMAVTGACLLMKKSIFNEVDGFDERFALAFNDIDLCIKVHEKGYRNVFTPFAELYHHESKTRGYEDTPEKQERFSGEVDLFKIKWPAVLSNGDIYYQ